MRNTVWLVCVSCISLAASDCRAQFGSTLNGLGPVSRSMAGATTAAPLDSLGAFQSNPATITALPSSMDFGMELLFPHSTLSSRVNAGSFGPGIPPVTLSGSTESDTGVFPLPEFGLVYQPRDSDISIGVGVLTVGGFGVNYPGSPLNPILSPPPPNGLGVGPVFTQYQLMQVVPTMAVQLTDQLAVGFSPVIGLAGLSADPGILVPPDAAAGGPFATYPPMTHGSYQWGGGFQIGAFYVTDNCWQFGASYKSTTWFNDFEYNSRDQTGAPRHLAFGLDAPMTISLGTAWTGADRWLLSVDARYLDYGNTEGYEAAGFTPAGAVAGLGWDSIYTVAAGVQYELTEAASIRGGYSANTNPIDDGQTFFNAGAPLIIEHGLYVGGSWNLSCRLRLSAAYSHYFENDINGQLHVPGGAVGGTSVRSAASADSLLVGATVLF